MKSLLSAIMLGIGVCLFLSVVYPCPYNIGADKSNMIQMVITFVIALLGFFIGLNRFKNQSL